MSLHGNEAVRVYGHGIDAAFNKEFRERRMVTRRLAAQADVDAGIVGFGDYTLQHPFHRCGPIVEQRGRYFGATVEVGEVYIAKGYKHLTTQQAQHLTPLHDIPTREVLFITRERWLEARIFAPLILAPGRCRIAPLATSPVLTRAASRASLSDRLPTLPYRIHFGFAVQPASGGR